MYDPWEVYCTPVDVYTELYCLKFPKNEEKKRKEKDRGKESRGEDKRKKKRKKEKKGKMKIPQLGVAARHRCVESFKLDEERDISAGVFEGHLLCGEPMVFW